MLKKVVTISILTLMTALCGCNTVHGVGQDVSAGGQALSKAADSTGGTSNSH